MHERQTVDAAMNRGFSSPRAMPNTSAATPATRMTKGATFRKVAMLLHAFQTLVDELQIGVGHVLIAAARRNARYPLPH